MPYSLGLGSRFLFRCRTLLLKLCHSFLQLGNIERFQLHVQQWCEPSSNSRINKTLIN